MPKNPNRSGQGGDVEGEFAIDVTQGASIKVANASKDPGYSLETTLSDAGTKIPASDLTRGYCDYGKSVGEGD